MSTGYSSLSINKSNRKLAEINNATTEKETNKIKTLEEIDINIDIDIDRYLDRDIDRYINKYIDKRFYKYCFFIKI